MSDFFCCGIHKYTPESRRRGNNKSEWLMIRAIVCVNDKKRNMEAILLLHMCLDWR